jgi:hypothetical protein
MVEVSFEGSAASPGACLHRVNAGCGGQALLLAVAERAAKDAEARTHRDGIRPHAGARRLTSIKGGAWREA